MIIVYVPETEAAIRKRTSDGWPWNLKYNGNEYSKRTFARKQVGHFDRLGMRILFYNLLLQYSALNIKL